MQIFFACIVTQTLLGITPGLIFFYKYKFVNTFSRSAPTNPRALLAMSTSFQQKWVGGRPEAVAFVHAGHAGGIAEFLPLSDC